MPPRTSHWLVAALVVWIAGSAAAMAALEHYSLTPGPRAAAPAVWPSDSALQRTKGHATALLFAHPRCPCTRASLLELKRALEKSDGNTDVSVVLVSPSAAGPDWERARVEGATRVLDVGGDEARRFGALTSGEVVFYDEGGTLLFSGGITPSRDHEGESTGRSALEALLRGQRTRGPETPVFGCQLHDPTRAQTQAER